MLFVESHNEIVTREGDDLNSTLEELARFGYATFVLNGDPIRGTAFLNKPVVRIVATRNRV